MKLAGSEQLKTERASINPQSKNKYAISASGQRTEKRRDEGTARNEM